MKFINVFFVIFWQSDVTEWLTWSTVEMLSHLKCLDLTKLLNWKKWCISKVQNSLPKQIANETDFNHSTYTISFCLWLLKVQYGITFEELKLQIRNRFKIHDDIYWQSSTNEIVMTTQDSGGRSRVKFLLESAISLLLYQHQRSSIFL